ncbi:XXYS1_4_G0045780.mRNA.1.CDS.1 [Saccharomyces cerevisiae]|nr:XXYS1_4_G0045780.mRNA.1.CDS.1 [Saccharomyces cerevisiae]CAD6609467.1 EM14S01-3B_G0043030.mRNA.1.CDS.1 [Saccharomyces cerevisiae]CAI4328877.1 AMH_1a_G0008690.mRNA.1.CDS.1 [Saccharomyces cerevisiae]CAI4338677.1 CEI_1a_G0008830.mRNA.1.CDS.1 [Saccharomyces cerevisiae]CAI6546780.1 AMH_1a_G0008690.mRNA.1.CDS.1 [Saccharomyces cerevisiae]
MSLYQSIVFIARNVFPHNPDLFYYTQSFRKNISFHFFHDFKYCSADTRHYSQLIIFPVKENSRPTQVSRPLGGRSHESVFLPKFTRTQNTYCLTRLDRMGFPPPRKASTIMHFFQDDRTVMCSPKDGIPVSSFHIMICFLERRKGN